MTLRHDFIPRLTVSDADDCTTILSALTIYVGIATNKANDCTCRKPVCGFLVEAANAAELLDIAIYQLDSITQTDATFGKDMS